MHAHCFDIALFVPCLVSNDETADLQVFDLLSEFLIWNVSLRVVISVHHKASKRLEAGGAEDARSAPRQNKTDSVLRYPINALHI